MLCAVMADIHGNITALSAVLHDARLCGAQLFIFAGDYFLDLPHANEVCDTLRVIENALIVSGNKERYMPSVSRAALEKAQMAPLRWNIENMNRAAYKWLTSLPAQIIYKTPSGAAIRINHTAAENFDIPGMQELNLTSNDFIEMMQKKPFSHSDYLAHAHKILEKNETFCGTLRKLADDVYIFGHTHVQWHARVCGRLIINPGSCGMPCDYDPRAAYTLLDTDSLSVYERRVNYDLDKTESLLKASELFTAAPLWSNNSIKTMRTGIDRMGSFLQFLNELAIARGDNNRPVSDETWRLAVEKYGDVNEF